MANAWINQVRNRRTLKVHNAAGAWRGDVTRSMSVFNGLSFRVTLESVNDAGEADVVVLLSGGTGSYTFHHPYYGEVRVNASFDATRAHGKTKSVVDPDRQRVAMAAIFLPQRLQRTNPGVRQVVTVHEFIHAAGLNSNGDHDTQRGVFYSPMELDGGKLKPWGTSEPGMPPITVGARTTAALNRLWTAA